VKHVISTTPVLSEVSDFCEAEEGDRMTSFKTSAVALTAVLGAHMWLSAQDSSLQKQAYSFDPGKVQQNICGPIGANRGLFFKPELVQLMSSAVNAAEIADETVPIIPGLDARNFPISSENPAAGAYFRQGFALLYAFNHWEAIRAFNVAQELDPNCAICYWGEATALAPNINAPMSEENAAKALKAISKAQELIEYADAREKALINAASKRFGGKDADQNALNKAYADAMAEVVAAFPEDQDIATLYAEALMTVSPWDYWERDFATPRPHIKTAIDTIEAVFAKNPEHYGAIHLYIHLYEATAMAAKAAPYADKLAGLAPGSGHLVHMPGHIYFRIGRYIDSLTTNVTAVAVDEAYLEAVQGSNLYRYGYFPHNVHFVMVSAQMAGDGKTALEYAAKLDAIIPAEALKVAGWIAPIKAAPYFAYAQFGDEAAVSALPDPGDDIPLLKAMWHYARGLVFAQSGNAAAAGELDAINALISHEAIKGADIPAANILEIGALTIEAKMQMASGDHAGAVDKLQAAVKLQDAMPYTEPPFWYYAIEQSIGAALFEAGQYDEAARAFEASLVRHPNSAWSLFALKESYEKLGQEVEAEKIAELLKKASRLDGAPEMIQL
jgi:tetratricopeptide (TPR) repeat protein